MTERSRARRVLMITLAGMVAAGLGENTLPSLSGQGGFVSQLLGAAQAVVFPSVANATVSERTPAKVSSRSDSAAPSAKVTAKKAGSAKQGSVAAKSKRKKKKRRAAKSAVGRQAGRGRCEPQSLTYARQRSGIMRSRTGPENGPLTWFASEAKLGKTTAVPLPGSVLILGSDRRHGMGTGHVAYVEQAFAKGPSTYRLIFSHTNYDRRCSLETNIEAEYDSAGKTLDIFTGAWQVWGKDLKVAGFIAQ